MSNKVIFNPDELFISVGIDVGADFSWMSIALPNQQFVGKPYKIPILYSFYNNGEVRLAVKDEDVLVAWKKFFDNGTNWKDFAADISYADYKAMTDKQHLSKAKSMPIKFLKSSGKGFFIEKEGYALAIRDDLQEVAGNETFKKHMKDILEYRTMEYYRKRYADSGCPE